MNYPKREIDFDFSVSKSDLNTAKENEKKVIRKLKIAFILLLILTSLSYYFLISNKGGFTSYYNKIIFTVVMVVIFTISFVVLFIHLNAQVRLKHYLKYYSFYDTLQFLVLVVVFIIFLQMFVIKTASISGESMDPTLNNGDEVLIFQAPLGFKNNDIVVIDATNYSRGSSDDLTMKQYYIKRIKAIPGDKVELKNLYNSVYEIYINGTKLDGNYKIDNISVLDMEEDNLEVIVPNGAYFLLGDNVENSRDSKSFGFVLKEDIIGKVNFRFWRKFGLLKWFSGIQDIWRKPKEK